MLSRFCAKVFPLRGKLLNVREMNQKSLAENKEALANFGRVKRMLGCQGLTGVFLVNVEKHENQMQLR